MKEKNQEGAVVIEATISLSAFMFLIVTILAITNICLAQAKIGTLVNGIAKDVSTYSYIYSMTGITKWEQGVSQKADIARKDINEVLSDTTDTYDKIEKIVDCAFDREFWESFKNLLGEQMLNTGKGVAMNKVCRKIAKDRLTNSEKDADAYLKFLGIKDGVKGLNFYKSEFCPQGKDDIKIVVSYKVHMLRIFGMDMEFQFEQCAKTKAWVAVERSSGEKKSAE